MLAGSLVEDPIHGLLWRVEIPHSSQGSKLAGLGGGSVVTIIRDLGDRMWGLSHSWSVFNGRIS